MGIYGLTTEQGIYGNMWEQMFLEHDFPIILPTDELIVFRGVETKQL